MPGSGPTDVNNALSLWRSPLDRVALTQAEALSDRQPRCSSIGYGQDISAMTVYNFGYYVDTYTISYNEALTKMLAAMNPNSLGAVGGALVPGGINRQVARHREQPAALPVVRHARDLVQVLPGPQEDLLHQVGRELTVAGLADEVGVHRGAVRLVEAAELSFPIHRARCRPARGPGRSS